MAVEPATSALRGRVFSFKLDVSPTTLELYAEKVPNHEREVARTMDAFVKAALGGKAPEERSFEAFREAVTSMSPEEWPDWVLELAELAGSKR